MAGRDEFTYGFIFGFVIITVIVGSFVGMSPHRVTTEVRSRVYHVPLVLNLARRLHPSVPGKVS